MSEKRKYFATLRLFIRSFDRLSERDRRYIARVLDIDYSDLLDCLSDLKILVVQYENYHS
nr:MAG TPA: hypothetical protein [Inoviridae sp.]